MATSLPPVERPRSMLLRLIFFFARRQFGRVLTPLTVFSARMPVAFASFYGKVSKLDGKLQLPSETSVLVRARVASINTCLFCLDATRWYAQRESPGNAARLDALADYETSPLFSDAERAALDYATELTRDGKVSPDTFAQLARYYGEREICDIVWLVASEHLYNVTNVGLNIGSDGLCELSPRPAPAAAARD